MEGGVVRVVQALAYPATILKETLFKKVLVHILLYHHFKIWSSYPLFIQEY